MEPPKEFLEAIGFKNIFVEMIFPAFNTRTEDIRGYDFVITMIFFGVRHFFFQRYEDSQMGGLLQRIGDVLGEAISNAAKYGNHFKGNIKTGLWVGEEGIVCGIKDKGDFYNDPVIIQQVEARIPVPSATKGWGMELYCELADGIKVSDGVLYLMLLKKTMMAWMTKGDK